MKKFLIIAIAVLCSAMQYVNAQGNSYFDEKGAVRLETVELDQAADTLVTLFHRADDIVWSRIVYRVVDMRYKQNYQLYFPTLPNEEYRSLFRVMLQAICDGVPFYTADPDDIRPVFSDARQAKGATLSRLFAIDGETEDSKNEYNLVQYDSLTNVYSLKDFAYGEYVRNQIKFLIQEIYFFDKHTSRLHSKIIAIAPLYALHPDRRPMMEVYANNNEPMNFFKQSILGWFSFDELRRSLAKQYIIPKGNDAHRVTYDEFFAKHLFASYLLGDSNMFNRMLMDYVTDMKKVKKEQERIETELLNFEQDLWEY